MAKVQETPIIIARLNTTSQIVVSIIRAASRNECSTIIKHMERETLQNLIRTVYTALNGEPAMPIPSDKLF